MRIIGTIEHPFLKISVFKNEGRLSLKLENEGYEQTYKLGDDDRFSSVEDVQKLADDAFLRAALEQFRAMHQNRMAALNRSFPQPPGETFEDII